MLPHRQCKCLNVDCPSLLMRHWRRNRFAAKRLVGSLMIVRPGTGNRELHSPSNGVLRLENFLNCQLDERFFIRFFNRKKYFARHPPGSRARKFEHTSANLLRRSRARERFRAFSSFSCGGDFFWLVSSWIRILGSPWRRNRSFISTTSGDGFKTPQQRLGRLCPT